MASILKYIDNYGDKTFKQEKLNEVDCALLSYLSYIDFTGIVKENRKILLQDAIKEFFKIYDKKKLKTHGIGLKDSYKMYEKMMDKPRYKDLELYNYIYVTNDEIQFSSLCIDISNKETFISIEGTDDEVVAWKEDFEMAYMFPVPAQKMCMDYLKNNVKFFSNRKYIIGGHSKGGNLALVGSMFLPFYKRMKIKDIYSFDGPGLNDKEFNSKEYKRVENKYHIYLPNYSIVGIMLNNKKDWTVVKSKVMGIKAHLICNWDVEDNKFTTTKLSAFSKGFDKVITKWRKSNDKENIKNFIEDLFSIFDRCNIHNLCGLNAKDIKEITTVAREAKNISPESKEMIKQLGKIFIETIKEETFTIFKSKKD